MELKSTISFHLTPIRMVIPGTQAIINIGVDVGKKEHSYIAGGVENWCSHSGKQYRDFSENLK